MNLKLIEKRNETENIKTFIFQPDEKLSWTSGQYLIYSLPHENQDLRGKQRFFTISSPPFMGKPSITTRIEKEPSSFKKALNDMTLGDTITAKGPDGDFIVDDFSKKYVLIAGGIGITPYRSILRQLNFEKRKTEINLVYGTSDKEFLFEEELKKLELSNSNIAINFVKGRMQKKHLDKFLDGDFYFFISGPDPMVESMENMLKELQVKKEKIKSDYFSGYKNY